MQMYANLLSRATFVNSIKRFNLRHGSIHTKLKCIDPLPCGWRFRGSTQIGATYNGTATVCYISFRS